MNIMIIYHYIYLLHGCIKYMLLYIYRNDPTFSVGVGKPHHCHFIRLHNFNSHSFTVDNKKYSVFLNKTVYYILYV